MKKGQFTEEQIVRILQQAERGAQTIGAICREHGIAENTFYRWRQKLGGSALQKRNGYANWRKRTRV